MIKAKVRINPAPGTTANSGVREVVVAPLYKWALQFQDPARSAHLTIPGNNAEERDTLIRCYLDPRYDTLRTDTIEDVQGERTREWLEIGAVDSFVRRVATLRIPAEVRAGLRLPDIEDWELLWGLMRVDPFIVEEPLRAQLDQSWSLLSEAHKGLWEARFLDRENADKTEVKEFVASFARWMVGRDLSTEDIGRLSLAGIKRRVERDEDRLDLACLVLTLCGQNGLLNRAMFGFDGVEQARSEVARGLLGVMRVTDRWVRMGGSPIGLFVGSPVGREDMGRLKRLNPHLADRVSKGLAWTC